MIQNGAQNSIPLWAIVITSASVGAFASAGLTLISQTLERRSRRRELALSKAIEIAIERTELVRQIASQTGSQASFADHAALAETYFRWLVHLIEHDELPTDAHSSRTKHELQARGQIADDGDA